MNPFCVSAALSPSISEPTTDAGDAPGSGFSVALQFSHASAASARA